MDTFATIIALIALIGAAVSWIIIWRVDQYIDRSMDLTGERINRMEADASTLKARINSVEHITAKHSQQICELNQAVFDKNVQNNE